MNHQLLKKMASLVTLMLLSTLVASGQVPAAPQPVQPADVQAEESDGDDLIESIKRGDLAAVAKILFAGTSANETENDAGLPLCWAVRVNRRDIVELLLEKGADVNKAENDGSAPLDVATVFGHADMVKLLLSRGAVVDHKDRGGHTALITAVLGAMVKDAPPFVRKALWSGDDTEEEEQLLANIGNEHKTVMELLIQAGADVNLQGDDCGMTALMFAALDGSADLVQSLLAHGASVNLKTGSERDDWDALGFAEILDTPEGLALLLEHEDEGRKQALLTWSQTTSRGRQQVARMLRAAGARK